MSLAISSRNSYTNKACSRDFSLQRLLRTVKTPEISQDLSHKRDNFPDYGLKTKQIRGPRLRKTKGKKKPLGFKMKKLDMLKNLLP